MKTTISIIILAIVGACVFSACTVLPTIAAIVDPSSPPEDWAEKAHFAKLMSHPKKKLLTEDEKLRASKNICVLKHLDKYKNNKYLVKKSKTFCTLKQNDKIYFYDWCMECGGGAGLNGTSYLLVRNGKAFKSVTIEQKYSKELKKSVPIVDRLH